MTNIDEATGLPELPEGYFWRVKKSADIYVDVQLRKKMWLGSRKIEYGVLYRSEISAYKIRQTANYVLWKTGESKNIALYLGDYPPKKLEQ